MERPGGMEDIFQTGKDETLFEHVRDFPERLYLLSGLLYSACGVGSWCFNMQKELMGNTFPSQNLFLTFFQLGGCLDYAVEHAYEEAGPIILTDQLDLVWVADYVDENDGADLLIVVGPMFSNQSSVRNLEESLRRLNVSLAIRSSLLDKLQKVPVLSQVNIIQFLKMLHYIITGEPLDTSQIHYQQTEDPAGLREDVVYDAQQSNPELARAMEESLLQMVREGNIYATSLVDKTIAYLASTDYGTGEPKREMKNHILVFAALCARAAADGGLSAGVAKQLEIHYVRSIENCSRMTDLINLAKAMLKDFTLRVNRQKLTPEISPAIQDCCAYIHTHLREPILLSDIAKEVGYTEYYLTKKFRKETGERLVDYIKNARLELAKVLLASTRLSIQEISDELQFSSRTYFSKIFKEAVGVTPAGYRQTKGKDAEE